MGLRLVSRIVRQDASRIALDGPAGQCPKGHGTNLVTDTPFPQIEMNSCNYPVPVLGHSIVLCG
jgi:hypothetical protein